MYLKTSIQKSNLNKKSSALSVGILSGDIIGLPSSSAIFSG